MTIDVLFLDEGANDLSVLGKKLGIGFHALFLEGGVHLVHKKRDGEAGKDGEINALLLHRVHKVGEKGRVSKSTAFHILNHMIKNRSEECSSTVDLFDFDLITGEALFYKCGAAPSYVKRDNSIFRIRSETAPIGLIKSIDAERIRVEVKCGDYVVMLSDGVSQSPEDSAWLLELLSTPALPDIRDYADRILSEAIKHSRSLDDMSVAVAKRVKIA